MKFARNGIKNNNLNDLYPENDKIHKVKTRPVENTKCNMQIQGCLYRFFHGGDPSWGQGSNGGGD